MLRNPTLTVLRAFLCAALFALPLVAVVQRAAQTGGGGVGMGTRAPALLESLSKLSASVPGGARLDGFSFEVALVGSSARNWQLVGHFLRDRPVDTVRNQLIRFGSLQLEGG